MISRDVKHLAERGLVTREVTDQLARVTARYAFGITPTIASLIDKDDPEDPIARQFIPDERELTTTPDELVDPIGDKRHSPCEGIVHRYPDRVLLKLVQVCAVYCRFCFRRETVGPGRAPSLADEALEKALAYIARRPEIWEVILTGGDPLTLSPRRLRAVAMRLRDIEHVRVLRVHTRLPIAAPTRIGPDLIEALATSGKSIYVAIHANHPRELTDKARSACARLFDAGFCLVSQSVLLRGVNDNAETLADLMRAFVEARIKPYYLHHPDLAPGTGHFRVTLEEGQRLMHALLGRVSGLCRPHYMLDIPGGYGKSPIGRSYVAHDSSGIPHVTDFNDVAHRYPPSP